MTIEPASVAKRRFLRGVRQCMITASINKPSAIALVIRQKGAESYTYSPWYMDRDAGGAERAIGVIAACANASAPTSKKWEIIAPIKTVFWNLSFIIPPH